jgi:hypothetical protein
MKTKGQPKDWETAAEIVTRSINDMTGSHEFASMMDSNACQKVIFEEFEDIVELVFSSNSQMDNEILQEQFFDIAIAALCGYAYQKDISPKKASKIVREVVIGKQKMYGHGNIKRFGIPGITIRLNDKLERLKNLQRHGGPVLFEPIDDTWLDICGYAIIAIMWIEDWFLLEMRNNKQETSTNTGE